MVIYDASAPKQGISSFDKVITTKFEWEDR